MSNRSLQLQRILAFDHLSLPLKKRALFLDEFASFFNEPGLLLHQSLLLFNEVFLTGNQIQGGACDCLICGAIICYNRVVV